jgi:hypothetical protein
LNKTRNRWIITPVVVVLAVAGCAAEPEAAPPSSTPTPSATASTTIAQWASVVAEQEAYLTDWHDKWIDDECPLASEEDIICDTETYSGTLVVGTVALSLEAAAKPSAPVYIGEPHPEIAGLYADTERAADLADEAGTIWNDCTDADPAEGCFSERLDFSSAVDTLKTKFAAWGPYL